MILTSCSLVGGQNWLTKYFELTRHFLTTDIESTFTTRQDDSCSPPQISDITYNVILIGCVNSTEKVFSEVQCIWYPCVTFVYSIQHGNCGLGFQCTTLSIIESTEIKVGAAYRIFDRKSIQKFCRLLNFIVKNITEEDSSLCFYTFICSKRRWLDLLISWEIITLSRSRCLLSLPASLHLYKY